MPLQLVIADSNDLSSLGLSTLFAKQNGVEVIGTVSSAKDLNALLAENKADVVLMDYTCNEFGIDSVVRTKARRGAPSIVAITPEQSGITIVNALKAGVDSYIKKDCGLEEIIESVMETGRGQQFFCGQIVDVIRRENIDTSDLALSALSCQPIVLSAREQEVIILIAEGYTNLQIADKLFLSSHTVNTHRKNIMTKLGVKNTASIVMYAVKTELVSPNKFLFNAKQ